MSASQPLFRLVYHSQATQPQPLSALTTLLNKARTHNQREQLTGLLLYGQEEFMQVLEGPEPALGELYARIQADPRHRDVRTIHYGPIGQRAFPDWRMAFGETSAAALRQATGFLELTATPGLVAHPPRQLREQLREFARRAAATDE